MPALRRAFPLVLPAVLIALASTRDMHAQERGEEPEPMRKVVVGTYPQEVRTEFTEASGLPSNDVRSVAIAADGTLYVGTAAGLMRREAGAWKPVNTGDGPVDLLAAHDDGVLATSGDSLIRAVGDSVDTLAPLPEPASGKPLSLLGGETVYLGTTEGLYTVSGESIVPVADFNEFAAKEGAHDSSREVRQIASGPDGRLAVAAASGLFIRDAAGAWSRTLPRDGDFSWAPRDVRGVTFDTRSRLWFASPQGVGCDTGSHWMLLTGLDGLPYNDFTIVAPGEDGVVWFGTDVGAIRYDGARWNYRQGRRWLPHDDVRAIAVEPNGNAWFATKNGLSLIERRMMTLAEKAKFFEDQIDKFHRRTPYGYVLSVNLKNAGDTSEFTQHDSDNDGLWTGMYGAGECFAYAATKDPKAKERATAAFEALAFLSEVTQGGSHPAPPGFPARTILPTSGPNPNEHGGYTIEGQKKEQAEDPLWKVLDPRWPTSADGKWYWKSDTSSDELDGHYFMYALYYDLVAETDAEKARAREVVKRVTDHLIDHGYNLVDHDGTPTRWAIFGPEFLNKTWAMQRGLNSLSILSYLKTAEHICGDARYGEHYRKLIDEHSYATNAFVAKVQQGPGTGNQSDDEMAMMCYYNILNYEADPQLAQLYGFSLFNYWRLEQPERNPFFNYVFASRFKGIGRWVRAVPQSCLDDAADTLKRIPLDRTAWGYQNSHRYDVVAMRSARAFRGGRSGHLRDGGVVPIDERHVQFWNQNPWELDSGANGHELSDGAAFLLPYYMGLHHGFLE